MKKLVRLGIAALTGASLIVTVASAIAAPNPLRDALQEFARAARALRGLADQLERQPSSVIRGKTEAMGGGR